MKEGSFKVKKFFFPMLIIGILYILSTYYIGHIIFEVISQFLSINLVLYWLIIGLISYSYIIFFFFNNKFSKRLNTILNYSGSYWMFFYGCMLIIFPITDLILLFVKGAKNTANIQLSVGILIFLVLVFIGNYNAKNSIVNKYNIYDDGELTENLNIALVSDLHLGVVVNRKRLKKLVDELNDLNPDIILIAGDLVDTEVDPFLKSNMAEEFKNLKPKYGTFAALGNHDLMKKREDDIIKVLTKNNVNILRDEAILINNSFYIIGRDDFIINRRGTERKTLADISKDIDKSKYKIVIDHTPISMKESNDEGFNLHVSGHTHKGQISPGSLITKKMFEIDHGYLLKDTLNIFVSQGYGTWGPPLRLGSRSEIMNILVTPKSDIVNKEIII